MNKILAGELLKVFDTPNAVQTIEAYAAYEINKANQVLSTTTDTIEIFRLQGVVRAMTNLKKIRETAVAAKG